MPTPIGKPTAPSSLLLQGNEKTEGAATAHKPRAPILLKGTSSPKTDSKSIDNAYPKDFILASELYIKNTENPHTNTFNNIGPKTPHIAKLKRIETPWTGEIGKNDYLTQGGTKIQVLLNKDYSPTTTPQKVLPKDMAISNWLVMSRDKGYADNLENTDIRKLQAKISTYAKSNPKVMRRFGIKNIQHISPRQALLLAEQISTDISSYNHAAIEKNDSGRNTIKARIIAYKMDQWSIVEYFDKDKNGVCRNYTEIVQGVFESLKGMQQPKSESQLVNSYIKQPSSDTHAWNALYTVQPNGVVAVTQVDATWNDFDIDSKTANPSSENWSWPNTDYTLGSNGVRHYNLLKDLVNDTGDRPLKGFLRAFNNGAKLFDRETRFDKTISKTEVDFVGGIKVLSNGISALPEMLQPEALAALAPEIKQSLLEYRATEKLTPIRLKHKKGN
ncbi:hypothetical protein KAI87_08430 [Myxococcota bacterium]|nr:hypothetical protein [Myxococcota bacterium]